MSITYKTKEEIETLKEAGKRLFFVLNSLKDQVAPGVSLDDLNTLGESLIREKGDEPAFLNYTPHGATRPYPASICISVNDEIVHGIPNEGGRVLEEGDIVTLDAGLVHNGMYVDSAITVPVGAVSDEAKKLMEVTKNALLEGIEAALEGNRVGDISHAIESYVKKNSSFSIFKELVGHGVGYAVHEDPYVPNVGKKGTGEVLKEGMVIAIEPMLGVTSGEIVMDEDGYTYKTDDGCLSAHFEHTVAITKDGPLVLTQG